MERTPESSEADPDFETTIRRLIPIARRLVTACLENHCIQEYLADSELSSYTVPRLKADPIVRVEYEQATAIADMGSALAVTKSKKWGDGPSIMPLNVDDWFYPEHVTYIYQPHSRYQRRYEQRMRMKEILGKRWRKLVGKAKWHNQETFLRILKPEQQRAIWRCLNVGPKLFWRAAQGRTFIPLKPRLIQRKFEFKASQDHFDNLESS